MGTRRGWVQVAPVIAVLLVATVMLLGSAMTVQAAGPEQTPVIDVTVAPNGDAKICTGLLCLDSQQANVLLQGFNAGVQVPSLLPLRQAADANGIQSLTIDKQAKVISVGVNGDPAVDLELSDQALGALVDGLMPQIKPQMPWVTQANLTLVVHFAQTGAVPAPARVAYKGTGTNVVDALVVANAQGQVLSLGGLQPQQLGMPAFRIDPAYWAWVNALGVKAADVTVDGNRVKLTVNGNDWATVSLNIPAVRKLAQAYIPAAYSPMVDLATSWLGDSALTLHLALADAPSNKLPTVKVGRPVNLEVARDGSLKVEGFSLPARIDTSALSLLGGNGLAVAVDGPRQQVRFSGTSTFISFDRKLISTLGAVLMPGYPVDWNSITAFAANTELTLQITQAGGAKPAAIQLAQAPAPGAVAVEIPVQVGTDGIAVFGEKLPLERLGVNLGQAIAPYRTYLRQIRSLTFGVNSISVDIDGSSLMLVVDPAMRKNLVDYGVTTLARSLNFPATANTTGVAAAVNNLLASTAGQQARISLAFSDGPLPGGLLEGVINLFAPARS